ncbi:MAG: hypothetical protein IJM68_02255 [Synergistaceae bacterium]|nr:hypothetical protein [Synergistaceae bacterium]
MKHSLWREERLIAFDRAKRPAMSIAICTAFMKVATKNFSPPKNNDAIRPMRYGSPINGNANSPNNGWRMSFSG